MQAMGRALERAQQEAQARFSPDPETETDDEEADPPPIHDDDDDDEEEETPKGPPVFALSPALARTNLIDYRSSAGAKIWKQATEALPHPFNGEDGDVMLCWHPYVFDQPLVAGMTSP